MDTNQLADNRSTDCYPQREPASAKGVYMKSITLINHGPGVRVDTQDAVRRAEALEIV